MKRSLLLIATAFVSGFAFGQKTNFEQFKQYFKEKDTAKLQSLFVSWEKSAPDDPELYTSRFNYYFSESRKEVMALQKANPNTEGYQLTDSSGAVVGYLAAESSFNPQQLQKAFIIIDKGIRKFPDRLDMRFGKIYALGVIEDYPNFAKNIIQTVNYSAINKNNWLWTENQKHKDGKGLMLGSVQSYLKQLYDTEDDNLLPYMIDIGEATLKHYPDNIEILSTTSVALILMKKYDKALQYLKHAAALKPDDFIVLNNIAQAYKLKGDKVNAVKYYELTEKYGDAQAKQQAREQIKALQQ